MDVANPEKYQTWGEYKREVKRNKKRRLSWMQRVMWYAKQELCKYEEMQADSDDDEEDDDDDFSDGELVQDNTMEQNTGFMESQGKNGAFKECLGFNKEMQQASDDDEADGGFLDGGLIQDNRMEQNTAFMASQEKDGAFEECLGFNKEAQENSEDDEKDDDFLDGELAQDNRNQQNPEFMESQENNDALDKYLRVEMADMVENLQDTDFEKQMHPLDNGLERFDHENQGASARDEHSFEEENASENAFDHVHVHQHFDEFEALEDHEVMQSNNQMVQEEEAQRIDDNDVVGEELDDFGLDLAMGGAEVEEERVRNYHCVESLLFEVHSKEREHLRGEDLTKNEERDENFEHFEEDSGFDSQNSASSGSENGELHLELSYSQNMEEDNDLELNRFEHLAETDWQKASTQEEVEEVTKTTKDEHAEEEETTTTDDDDDILSDEDMDCYDLNEIKTYSHDHHVVEMFQTLKDFKDAQILTDLQLKTSDGRSTHVHAIVLSGVSYLVKRFLTKHHSWDKKTLLIKVGEDVEYEALKAVIEFAYTGAIRNINSTIAHEIKAAARYLGAPKVIEVCDRELAKSKGRPEKKFLSPSAELRLSLQKIRELWTYEMGCDITLDVLSASFEVHKVILAASSDYFRAMFTLGMKESSQSSIYLKFLSAPELEALLDCSYSGSITLSWNCIFEITSTALQLQYQPVLDLCLKFLQKEINPHSCLDVISFAEAFGMLKLLEFAEDYVLRQFQKVARTAKFKDLPARNLLKYLNSFALCVPSELVVFRAVVDWIQAKPKKRLKLAKELMKTIHFPLMTFKEFKEVQALKMWSNHSLQELYEAIFEDFCSNGSETQSKCRIYLPKESLVLSGGDQISEDLGTRSISKDLWFGNSLRNHMGIKKVMEWRRLGEMPQPSRFSHEVAVLNGQLYVVGGKKYYGTADTLNSVVRYNPLENSWEDLASMHQARCCFALVVFDSKLYAIGGKCQPDYIETVERYCPTANSWSFTCPLDLPLGGHVGRVLAGQIFVSGGLNNDYDSLSSMFSYDPEKGCTYLENMSQCRALHCMEVLGDCLYVAGGLSLTDRGIVDMLACEMYNPLADSWTSFPPLPVPHVGSGSAVLEGKFYVLGGYSQEDYSDTKMVHRYDPTLQQWENMGKMPGPNNDLRACVLCLPEHLRLCPD